MAVRDFLLPLVSYPKPMASAAIDAVLTLGESLSHSEKATTAGPATKTRISALVYEIEIQPGLYFEGAQVGEFLEAEARKSAANAQQLVRTFEDAAARHSVLHRCRLERRTSYEMSRQVLEAARLHHVTVQALRKDAEDQLDITEELVFDSGRPVLVFPETPVRKLAADFRNVAIAWDGSRPATRAVADAIPFLRHASSLRVFTATDDKPMAAGQGQQFIDHLASLGIEAIHEDVKKTDQHSIGSFMESYVASRDIDLLVMGAYGHSRLREFILGGATRSILTNPPCWVLLSH